MYQALYRKYRPQIFSDVVGQSHVTSVLSNELKDGKISHAYLFNGSRGTGKTTCARILAKAINCLHPVDGNPCNECEMCKGIDSGSITDVIENDAASNRGIDSIRDLRDEANFTPANAKYRVYIIDEVHMLTIEAFNALLKILEEPPEHVKFILATTEVHKMPATILSRCQRFDFRRISPEDISERLKYVCSCEDLKIDSEAAMLIARIADGALRDALSLLDQCASRSRDITTEIVNITAGLAGRSYLYDLTEAIISHDISKALQMIDELHNSSCDMEKLCTEIINHLRNIIIIKAVKNPDNLIICSKEEMEKIREQSGRMTLENVLYSLSVFEETVANLKKGFNRRIETEMAFIRLCNPKLLGSNEAILSRISSLENAIAGGITPAPIKAEEPSVRKKEEITPPVPEKEVAQEEDIIPPPSDNDFIPDTPPKPQPAQKSNSSEDEIFPLWAETLQILEKTNKPLKGLLAGSTAILRGDIILIKSNNVTLSSFIKIDTNRRALSEAVNTATGRKYRLGIFKNDDVPAQPVQVKDPLENLINKINETDIPFNVE